MSILLKSQISFWENLVNECITYFSASIENSRCVIISNGYDLFIF